MNPTPRAYAFGNVLNFLLIVTMVNFFCVMIDFRFIYATAATAFIWFTMGMFAPEKTEGRIEP